MHARPVVVIQLTGTQLGLIDVYRIFLNPVVIGGGIGMFAGVTNTVKLKLLSSRALTNDVMVLEYAPESV